MQNIYIIGHFGGYNVGDEAMLGGFLSIIPEERVVKIKYKNKVYIGWGKNINIYQGSFISFIKQLKKDDLLILCGGTHFHDDYTFSRLLRHWLYLSRISYMFLLAKRKGAVRLCIGNGFGPINQSITKYITKKFAGLCNKLTVRDPASFNVLKKMKISADLIHSDLANLLYLNYRQDIHKKAKQNIVGVSITSLKSVGKISISDHQLVKHLADALKEFADVNKDVIFRLFVIRSGERESDHAITAALETALKTNNLITDLYTFDNNLKELIESMSECSTFIASRFHSAVLTSIIRSKLIILSYHKKLTEFAAEISLPTKYIFDLQEENILNQFSLVSNALDDLYKSTDLNYTFDVSKIEYLKQQLQNFL